VVTSTCSLFGLRPEKGGDGSGWLSLKAWGPVLGEGGGVGRGSGEGKKKKKGMKSAGSSLDGRQTVHSEQLCKKGASGGTLH